MKLKHTLLTYLVFCTLIVQSQNFVVSNEKQNIIYMGIPNPLGIIVEGYKCNQVIVSTDNGQIKRTEGCDYEIYPDSAGMATIKITSLKVPSKVLGISKFRVKRIPNPVALVSGKSGGEISRSRLRAELGIVAELYGFDIQARFGVISYSVVILKKENRYLEIQCTNARFPQEVEDAFRRLEIGDKVVFSKIKCKSPDARLLDLQSIEFNIIE